MAAPSENTGVDFTVIRAALRDALVAHGYVVASDTLGLRRDLYLVGEDDLARALFEFQSSADDATLAMYQGAWTPGLPPRFAVIPVEERDSDAIEMLQQIHATPLFFAIAGDVVTFERLDELLAEHLKA